MDNYYVILKRIGMLKIAVIAAPHFECPVFTQKKGTDLPPPSTLNPLRDLMALVPARSEWYIIYLRVHLMLSCVTTGLLVPLRRNGCMRRWDVCGKHFLRLSILAR